MTRNDLRRARRRCATVTVLAALVAVAGTGYAPDNARAAGTQPRVSIADVLIGEGDGVVSVRVSLSERSASAVSMRYSMPNGNATGDVFGRPGFDFLARHGVTLTFAPGQRTKTIRIPILDDPDDEGLETFFVRLDSAMNATIANGMAAVRIRDND